MQRWSRVALIAWVCALAGCATSFTGSPMVEGGPRGCARKCEETGMDMASFVYVGEYSTGCVCSPRPRPAAAPAPAPAPATAPAPSPAASPAAAASGAAAVGVVLQMRERERQQAMLQQRALSTQPPSGLP